MATLKLCHRGQNYTTKASLTVPDGEHEWVVLVDNCVHCGNIYGVTKSTDRFCSPECQQRHHKPRKDPARRYKPRKAS
jgi:hypothetical protein